MQGLWLLISCLVFCPALINTEEDENRKLTIFTVATQKNDGYLRFQRSCEFFELEVVTLGMGQKWQGGDMNYPGGGWKVNLLKEELKKRSGDDGMMMFTDSFDVILAASSESILGQYDKMDGGIIFGAENFCWPDVNLKEKYPAVDKGYKYLNSGGFIGSIKDIHAMLSAGGDLKNTEDDQLFYTNIFLDPEMRNKFNMKLDHKAEMFQNLNGVEEEIELEFEGEHPYFFNMNFNTMPMVFHGNGPSKLFLNTLGNYIPGQWHKELGCEDCWRDSIDFSDFSTPPRILLAIFIEEPTPFMDEFFERVVNLEYQKTYIDLVIHNAADYHSKQVAEFVEYWGNENMIETYKSIKVIPQDEQEVNARNEALELCTTNKCDFVFVIDSVVHLDNPNTLKLLIEQNREVVAPMMIRPYTAWSNFWGALNKDGFYARSLDYMEIVNSDRLGLWNVPYLSSCYLVSSKILRGAGTQPDYLHPSLDPDMAFALSLRKKNIFKYVSNRANFGHLINNEKFGTIHLNNELWEVKTNRYDWERRYLHENYSQSLVEGNEPVTPCPDVYWFPVFTEKFCDEFVAEAENFGQWSKGTNNDERLAGGYEAVPTRDIHMNQIGFDDEWLYILDTYVRPLQEHVFIGYFHQPPKSIMNFMVRYRPDEQPYLRPHHDSSTYTINVALNTVGVDYEGGGCNFLRYKCKVQDTKKGHLLLHPGRLTHYHEGLHTTKGTRYIMISFVDP
jgi:procollagen-lysine,2-oxoglutarate 5-dioxygenase